MASGASPSSSATRSDPHKHSTTSQAEKRAPASKEVAAVIDSLKKKLAADRCISIKKRIDENKKNVRGITQSTMRSCMERGGGSYKDGSDLLVKRQRDSPGMKSGLNASDADKSNNHSSFLEDGNASSTTMVQGSSVPVKISLRPIKMPDVKRLSPYTTWVFLDRNQRMTEDQSVVGRRRIYYDQTGGEALICSDSEEEAIDEEDEKRAFVEPEDFIIRMTLDQLGLSDSVLEELANFLSRSSSEIKARYEVLMKEKEVSESGDNQAESSLLNKDMDGALDSFDNLFCRRCLVFDCRLHGCSQDLIFPAEKPAPWTTPVDENLTCGANCYKTLLKSNRIPANGTTEDKTGTSSDGAGTKTTSKFSGKLSRKKTKTFPSESASSNEKCTPETSDSENGVQQDTNPEKVSSSSKVKASGRRGGRKRNNNRVAERVSRRTQKRQKKSEASDTDSIATGSRSASDAKHKDNEDATSSSQKHVKSGSSKNSRKNDTPVEDSKNSVKGDDPVSQLNAVASEPCSDGSLRKEEFVGENVCPGGLSEDKSWRPLEKSLFQKGVEIFGMNSCMIARNLLCGLKSCWEVFQYMTCSENKASLFGGDALNPDGSSKFDINGNMTNNQVRRRSRFLRRRGKVRRLKYTWKSAAYHSIRKKSTDKKDQPCRQFNPCNCKTACGKECTCLLNGTCCEKYCGCPKSCKNRFRGCHCAKSQCRSRQCPCFAADRECDPDVCRNCWVIGGDGTLGVPSQRGDNYECRNMKLLLKQQQRVLLGISDVSGWGAFLKNSVSKHEYLGEYTGELISHKEADKRGKIYDRENSSFLFNLNDQFVLDAYRKGDKLKFANHSPEPNCYAKVIMVAGDHRVGIFAKERILAGEELFYDYRYEPDRAPAWARKPEASGSKKDENVTPSVGRPKKVA
ncbi:PREDICTED: histone-lysine N-methyltransferase CLF isoform X1 [Brassica oleracea var. oleracea]|uniref:histone-lysine N-methyltransferase CLF isoform X1 n=1 Tax=Brassica oleracea var. oleracea TaxID=109376 RepID=UPI0006A74FDC|nr:PREDICTED: histone-lysine N-methyltransferase CLF isoform X1 [Brassica oleracea var. oleracea]